MRRRPLFILLWVWIWGECIAAAAGLPLAPATALDIRMAEETSATVRVSGTVRQLRRTSSGYSYVLTGTRVWLEGESCETRGLLVFTGDSNGLAIGDRIEAAGTLSPFDVPGNPGQFDFRAWYRAQGIDFRLKEAKRQVIRKSRLRLPQQLIHLREKLTSALERLLPAEESAVLGSMLLGDRSRLGEELRLEYQMASLAHLLSISGLHISLLGMGLCRLLRRAGMPAALQLPLGSGLLAAYVFLVGESASARRAWIMFCLWLGAQAAGRTYDMLSALSAAGLLLLWEHPLLLFQNSFQLSLLAVLGVGGVSPLLASGRPGRASSAMRMSLAVQWLVWPVIAVMNGVIPLAGIPIGLAALPCAGPLLIFGGAGAVLDMLRLPGAGGVILPARAILWLYRKLCRAAALSPGGFYVCGCPGRERLILYYAVLLAALALRKRAADRKKTSGKQPGKIPGTGRKKTSEKQPGPVRKNVPEKGFEPGAEEAPEGLLRRTAAEGIHILHLLAFSAVLLALLHPLPHTGLSVTCIDVGQGDGILIRGEGGTCLIDAGSSQVEEVGYNRVLPYLHHEAVSRLDLVILTHADADHMNGLAAVLADPALTVGALCVSSAAAEDPALAELTETARRRDIPVRVLTAGDSWQLGEERYACLYPDAAAIARFAAEDRNETSLVIRLEGEGASALFTGDLGIEGEQALLSQGELPRADVLKVGHHGSRYASGEEFLAAVSPRVGLISCGAGNRYGHPHPDTLARLSEQGCAAFSTAEYGALTVTLRTGELQLRGFRSP